jgi:antitoxin YefM
MALGDFSMGDFSIDIYNYKYLQLYSRLFIGVLVMETINYTEARQHFRHTMETVCDSHQPVIITRQHERPVVMMSLEDYNSMQETFYLLRSPKNAARLLQAVENVKNSQNVQERELDESGF